MTLRVLVATAVLVCLSPRVGRAQEWLRDRRLSEGAGIRLGDSLVLHPGIGFEAGYDTNIFFANNVTADGAEQPYASARLRTTPHLYIATRPPQRSEMPDGRRVPPNVDFRAGIAATYHEYLSGESAVVAQRNIGLESTLVLELLPERPWTFRISNDYLRYVEPPNEPLACGGSVFACYFNRHYDRLQLELQAAPGGRALTFKLGYGFVISYFEPLNMQPLGNYIAHDIYLRTAWRWLPKTALLTTINVTPTDYFHPLAVHPDVLRISVTGGLSGSLTPRTTLTLLGGYAAGFYQRNEQYDAVIGKIVFAYLIAPVSRVELGAERDFFDSIFGNFYERDYLYLRYHHMFGGRFQLALSGGVARNAYATVRDATGALLPGANPNPRTDLRLDAGLFLEYRIQDWFGINATAQYTSNYTDFVYTDPATSDRDGGSYSKFVVYGGIRLFL